MKYHAIYQHIHTKRAHHVRKATDKSYSLCKTVSRLAKLLSALAATLLISACQNSPEQNFSGYPGFADYFAANPPSTSLPSAHEQALLMRYKPRLFIAKGEQLPVDFYADYISRGTLYQADQPISGDVTQALLNQYRDDPSMEFRFTGPLRSPEYTPTGYGRVTYDNITLNDTTYPLTFLNYNFAFPASGILDGIGSLSKLGIGLVGNNHDWHQLDHYISVSLALYNEEPIAFTLQQHNSRTTYVIGKDITLPADQRIAVDAAIQSNELHPHRDERYEHPAVSFITADNLAFVLAGEDKPLMAGFDITHGQVEVDYQLAYLPPADAFYQFKGWLGEKRMLPGRDGPPGADYMARPALLPYARRLVTAYRPGSVSEEIRKYQALHPGERGDIDPAGLVAYERDFVNDAILME